jgi:membrane protease YdiL (CAAX protease family)
MSRLGWIGPLGAVLLLLVCVWLPLLAWKSARILGGRGYLPITRRRLFVQTIILQALMFILALAAARARDVPLWSRPLWPLLSWSAAALFLVAALATLRLRWRSRPAHQKTRLYNMLPHDRRELAAFALVCVAAGVGEEVVYRGATTTFLTWLTGSFAVAAIVSAVAFALAHAVQGWRAMIAVFAIGLACQGLVWLAHSLIPAMAVHALYDFIVGLLVPRWYRLGLGDASGGGNEVRGLVDAASDGAIELNAGLPVAAAEREDRRIAPDFRSR